MHLPIGSLTTLPRQMRLPGAPWEDEEGKGRGGRGWWRGKGMGKRGWGRGMCWEGEGEGGEGRRRCCWKGRGRGWWGGRGRCWRRWGGEGVGGVRKLTDVCSGTGFLGQEGDGVCSGMV